MKNLYTRTLSSIVFVIVMIGSILWSHYSFILLFLIFTMIGLEEFFKIIGKISEYRPLRKSGIVLGALVYSVLGLTGLNIIPYEGAGIIFILMLAPFIITVSTSKKYNFRSALFTSGGILYIAVPFGLLTMIGNPSLTANQYSPFLLLGFFLLMWVYDSFAYLTGSRLGRNALAPKISPKKSWEGLVGGSVFTLLVSLVLPYIFDELNFVQWIIVAVLIIIFGTFGDLAESMLKRQAMTKDSGSLMPGHGGILDRFDGVLLSAPAVFIYLLFIWK